jgi:hypothetical protein
MGMNSENKPGATCGASSQLRVTQYAVICQQTTQNRPEFGENAANRQDVEA